MKKFLLLTVCALFSVMLFAQPAEIYIAEKVKVTFPGVPDSSAGNMGAKVLTYKKDINKQYGSFSLDLAPLGLSADMVASMGESLWEQIKTRLVGDMGNVDLLKDEMVIFKGRNCLKMEIDISKSTIENMKGKKAYLICFFNGSVLNQLNLIAISSDNMKDEAEAFFNTLTIE